jgi:hypothetical protein
MTLPFSMTVLLDRRDVPTLAPTLSGATISEGSTPSKSPPSGRTEAARPGAVGTSTVPRRPTRGHVHRYATSAGDRTFDTLRSAVKWVKALLLPGDRGNL